MNTSRMIDAVEAAMRLLETYRERVIKGELTGNLLEGDYVPTRDLKHVIKELRERRDREDGHPVDNPVEPVVDMLRRVLGACYDSVSDESSLPADLVTEAWQVVEEAENG